MHSKARSLGVCRAEGGSYVAIISRAPSGHAGGRCSAGRWLLVDFAASQTLRGLFPLENKQGNLDVMKNSDLALTNPLSGTTPHCCPSLEL